MSGKQFSAGGRHPAGETKSNHVKDHPRFSILCWYLRVLLILGEHKHKVSSLKAQNSWFSG
jgi:hypothetical protein